MRPPRGPVEGGTVITIEGKELGISFSDIERVLVGDVECQLVSSEYKPGTRWNNCFTGCPFNSRCVTCYVFRILCITRPANISGIVNITVWIAQTEVVTYESYEYLVNTLQYLHVLGAFPTFFLLVTTDCPLV